MDERIILEPERRQITGLGRSKWYELEAEGLAPKRRELTGNRTGHLLSELVEWVKARPIAKNAAPRAALAARGITTSEVGS
jgi:predicted DNA-binding transcriptional regulator AlpA